MSRRRYEKRVVGLDLLLLFKRTLKEAVASGDKFYFSGVPCKHGHFSERKADRSASCVECAKQRSMSAYAERIKNDQSFRQRRKENLESRRKDTRDIFNQSLRDRYASDSSWRSERLRSSKSYREKNLKTIVARNATRHAAKLLRTPAWTDKKKIKEFYERCPDGYHVDHIIPLQGTVVSGLHVLDNLQYLPAVENIKKGNRFLGE